MHKNDHQESLEKPAASAVPLTGPHIGIPSGTALAADRTTGPVVSTIPFTLPGDVA